MWKLLELLALAAVVLILITEFFYPLLTSKPLFGSFRRKEALPNSDKQPLNKKLDEAKEKVSEIKNIQEEVDEHFSSAKQLKKESDKLLNNPKK